jgi:small subunit ribosomal protein S16
MAVRIRMKKMGRTHRPYYRVCAMDQRSPRDGRVIEQLGTYDPMCPETDARVTLKAERIDYWLSVGAQPSEKVATLIKKYGTGGTHLEAQKVALDRLSKRKDYTPAPEAPKPKKKKDEPKAEAEAPVEAAGGGEASTEAGE